jgi:hypothetical protein
MARFVAAIRQERRNNRAGRSSPSRVRSSSGLRIGRLDVPAPDEHRIGGEIDIAEHLAALGRLRNHPGDRVCR